MEDATGNLVQITVLADFLAGSTIAQIARRIRVSRLIAEDRLRNALYMYGFTQPSQFERSNRVVSVTHKNRNKRDSITAVGDRVLRE